VVWLSGKAPTKDAKDLAAMVAKDTDGVTSVHNDIVVEP
jgi:osmotically-inducible protein OsmY